MDIRRSEARSCAVLGAALFVIATLIAGCGKPPTFNELIGNKPADGQAAPGNASGGTLPDVVQQPAAQKAEPPKPAPAQVIAQFKMKPSHEVSDRDLETLAALESGLEELTALNLSFNMVTPVGMAHLPKLIGVKELTLAGKMLDSASLESIGKMTQLEKLDLQGAQFAETDLKPLAELPNLKELNANGCPISDNTFTTFAKMASLEVLRIANTATTGAGFQLFDKLGARNNLRVIEAHHTSFGVNGFQHIKGWKNLEELIIGQAAVTDQGMILGMRGLNNLRKLDVSFNSVGDIGVREIVPLRKLEWLNLRNSPRAGDPGISLLKSLKNLRYLDMDGTAGSINVANFLKKQIPELKIAINGMTIE